MEGDKFPAVLMRGAERRLGIVNGDGDGEIKKEGGDEEIVGETVDEEEKVDGGKTSISRLPLFVDPISDYPCPRYIFPGQRPVRSLPSFLEVGPSDTGDHGNEKRMRYLRPRPVSMDTLTPYSIPSQSSTAIVKKDHTLSNLIKSAKGKLTAKKRPNKDIKAKLDKNTPTTNLNMSSSISPSTITLARNEATEIHQLIKECKLYISETLRISKAKMREAEEQGKVVFDAVEQHRLEVQIEASKLTSLIYAIQRLVQDSEISQESKMEVQDMIEECLGRGGEGNSPLNRRSSSEFLSFREMLDEEK